MKKIHLLTGNNSILQEHLVELPCMPIPHGLPGTAPVPEFMQDDIVLYQISDSSLDFIKQCIEVNPLCSHVCATEKITETQRAFFLQNGIAAVIQTFAPDKIAAYIDTILSHSAKNMGKLLIYDDKKNHIGILSSITAHFGCEPVFVGTDSDFFDTLVSDDFHFMLINLGSSNLALNAFVKQCHACPAIKKVPLIAYKDPAEGVFINELLSGINRYASYILSPEELYSFLIDIFFRKELMPLIDNLNAKALFNQFANYCSDSFAQIYYKTKDNILSLPDILDVKNLSSIELAVNNINRSVVGASALNWMHIEPPEIKTSGDSKPYQSNIHMHLAPQDEKINTLS